MNNISNFFSLIDLNRFSEYRTKDEQIREILEGSNPLCIPVCNSKNLITINPNIKATFVNYNDIKDLIEKEIIFLGKFENKFYFAVDVKEEKDFIKNHSSKFDDLRRVAPILNQKEAALLAYAKSMVYWRERVEFCGKCGSKTVLEDAGHKAFCKNCNSSFFPHTDPAIIVIVTNKEKCLLARQAGWPPKRYSVIAGFVEPGESLENAVSREVSEETGIKLNSISYHSSQPWPFPGSIMIGFNAEAETSAITLYDNELEDAKWFSREEIVEEVKQKELILSPEISISFRLVEDWFNKKSEIRLREILIA
jgi:NAD+ diphosphatase